MNIQPEIAIPRELLPSDGRFGSGPSRIPDAAVTAVVATGHTLVGTSHRKPPVKELVHGIRSGLGELYDLPDGYEVVLGIGGATAFWDAAAFGLVRHRSAHFVCGEFSSKFAAVTAGAPHLGEPAIIEAPVGSAPTPVHVPGVDASAFIHNETSTGVLGTWGRFEDELVLVDATSAAGVLPIDAKTVDAYYFSPQKAFGSEGGLWVALMSGTAIERIAAIAASDRWIPPFLSLATAVENSIKDQTYNTPAVITLALLDHQVAALLDTGGLTAAAQRSQTSSGHVYAWAESSEYATPFVTEPAHRSPTVVTVDLVDDVPADTVIGHLRTNGIVDVDSYRKLGRNQLRIATFPTIPTDDIEALTACIDFVVAAIA